MDQIWTKLNKFKHIEAVRFQSIGCTCQSVLQPNQNGWPNCNSPLFLLLLLLSIYIILIVEKISQYYRLFVPSSKRIIF